jgi:hypothetical protein
MVEHLMDVRQQPVKVADDIVANNIFSFQLEALVVCELVKQRRCYLEVCSKFIIV